MATKLGVIERERFKYGDAAGDGKGDLLRIHAIKAEQANSMLFSWLTGGASEVRLANALPVERGGTGGITAKSGRLNLGIFVDTNNQLAFGSKGISLYEGAVLDHDGSVKPTYKKVAVGHYEVGNVSGFAVNNFTYILPRDNLGNLLCACTITFSGTVATVKVYAVKFLNGVYSADTTKPINIPANRAIDISVK